MLRHPTPTLNLVSMLAVAMAAGPALAQTINVPEDQPTIIQAVNAANPGDTILVDDGTYAGPSINTEDLTIISVNGPATTEITGSIEINADKVTIGAPGQGFTIKVSEASYAIQVDGSVVSADTVIIQDNIFAGGEDEFGILIDPAIEGGRLLVQNNTFEADSEANFSFNTAIKFAATNFGDLGDLASQNATIDLLNNTIGGYREVGIRFDDDVFDSDVTVNPSTLESDPNSAANGIFVEPTPRSMEEDLGLARG